MTFVINYIMSIIDYNYSNKINNIIIFIIFLIIIIYLINNIQTINYNKIYLIEQL
jgi:hypothetical protein